MDKEKDGVWRTIRGRRIFIASGQSLGEAMAKSGKFKKLTRENIREAREEISTDDRMNRADQHSHEAKMAYDNKEKADHLNRKADKDWNKIREQNLRFTNSVYGTDKQAPKNRINENEPQRVGDTRVDKNYFRYSEADRRELSHEKIQKKLANYNYAKAMNDYRDLSDRIANKGETEKGKEFLELNKKIVAMRESGKIDHDKAIADFKAKKQSNNKVEPENKTFSSTEFEKNLPHEMRWKETDSVNDGKDLYWVSQEPFTDEMLGKFAEEFKKQGRYEKAYITTRDFSGYDYNDDLKRDTMAVIDKKGNINDAGYEKQMNKAGWDYRTKKSTENYPRAVNATKWEDLGLEVEDRKGFSDYLQKKYGTDDFKIINFDRKDEAKQIYEEFKNKQYYKGTKRWGFGYANDDNIPVYNDSIDYTGDFTHANLSKVSDGDLIKALNKQSELYHEASNRQVGDRRTYNGKKDQIFKKTEMLQYENGMKKLNEEMQNRNMPRYNIYNKKNNSIMVSSPTKEMADKQLKEMYETDKKLGAHYGWKEYPEYEIKSGHVDDYLNEVKDNNKTIKAFKEKKQSNNKINTNIVDYDKMEDYDVYNEGMKFLEDKNRPTNAHYEVDKIMRRIDNANKRGEGFSNKATNDLRKYLKENGNLVKSKEEIKKERELYKSIFGKYPPKK